MNTIHEHHRFGQFSFLLLPISYQLLSVTPFHIAIGHCFEKVHLKKYEKVFFKKVQKEPKSPFFKKNQKTF